MESKKYDTKSYCAKYYKKMKGGDIYNKIVNKNSYNYMMKRYTTEEEREKYLKVLQIRTPERYEEVKKLYDNYINALHNTENKE